MTDSNIMKAQLLSYEQCQEIVAKNDNFYEKVEIVNGYKVSVFNYILSVYDWFKTPFEGATYPAFEMRGITFVHTEQGPKRYLMLHKFFNLNENADTQADQLKQYPVIMVQEKLDGSMIRMIKFPDGKIVCKTKVGFSNDQSRMAMRYLESTPPLLQFVNEALDQGLAPIFELCSPLNRIVVNYSKTELRLIQMRDESTGLYLDIYNHPLSLKYGLVTSEKHPLFTFEELLHKQNTEEDREGYVVTLSNGVKFKLKTMWYFERHKLMDAASYENDLVKMICEEKLDDALTLLDKDNERRVYAEQLQLFLAIHIKDLIHQSIELSKNFNGSVKDFALANKGNPLFNLAVYVVNMTDSEKHEYLATKVKDRLTKDCGRLEKARSYLSKNGFKVANFETIGDQ